MADEEKTKIEAEEAETSEEPKKSLPIKKYGIYAVSVLVIIAAAYFVTLKVVKPMLSKGSATTEPVEGAKEKPGAEEGDGHGGESSSSGHGSAEGEVDPGNIFMISNIVVNPAGTGGTRFLSTAIGFEMSNAKAKELLEEREAVVRDALITILSSQSIPELTDFKQRERLRRLIKLRVEKLLGTKDIVAVYFTEFVLQ